MQRAGVVVLVMCLCAGALFASEARIEGLGKTNTFFRDVVEIYSNPALLYDYVNCVEGEFGSYAGSPVNSWAGMNLKLTEGVNLGLAVQREEGEVEGISDLDLYPQNGVNLLFNYKLESLSLGLGIYKSGNKEHSKSVNDEGDVTSESEITTGVLGIRLGGAFTTAEDALFEGAFSLNMNSYKHEMTTGDEVATDELDGGLALALGLRAFMPMFGEGIDFVPALGFKTFSYKSKYTNSANPDLDFTSGSISDMYLSLSLGLNYEIDGALVAGGVSFDYLTSKDESDTARTVTTTYLHLPRFNLGVEKELSERFTGRFGVQKILGSYTRKDERTTGRYDETSGPASDDIYDENFISAGLSANFGSLVIDTALETDALFNGSYIFSGVPTSLNYKLSVTYTF